MLALFMFIVLFIYIDAVMYLLIPKLLAHLRGQGCLKDFHPPHLPAVDLAYRSSLG